MPNPPDIKIAKSLADRLLPFALTDMAYNLFLLIYFKHQLTSEDNNVKALELVETIDEETYNFVIRQFFFYKISIGLDILRIYR